MKKEINKFFIKQRQILSNYIPFAYINLESDYKLLWWYTDEKMWFDASDFVNNLKISKRYLRGWLYKYIYLRLIKKHILKIVAKNMFDVYPTKMEDSYILEEKYTGYKFLVRRYDLDEDSCKGSVHLIDSSNNFLLLRKTEQASKQLYTVIMDRLTQYINHRQALQPFFDKELKEYSISAESLIDAFDDSLFE